MKVLSVQGKIRDIAKSWNKQYYKTKDPKQQKIAEKLAELDSKTATVENISNIIGNDSWTSLEKCDECWGHFRSVILFEDIQEMSEPYQVCESCLSEAIDILELEAAMERAK